MQQEKVKWTLWRFLGAFFPLQLLVAHLKYNLLALLYWLLLLLIVTDSFGSSFGIPLLFYSPEYLGHVSPISFLILGFSLGGFNMGFNTYSYMKLAPQFPFLASLVHPFLKFCVNNSLLTILFNIVFIINFSIFQAYEEYASGMQIFIYILSYLAGFILFHLLSVLYFFPLNNRARHSIIDPLEEKKKEKIAKTVIPNHDNWTNVRNKPKESEKAYLYFGRRMRLLSSRCIKHFKKDLLIKIYERNKVNATIFETLTLLSFISLGLFRENPWFEFPAAVSITLLLTIILMLFSALISWLHRWAYPLLIVVLISMDYLSTHTPFFRYTNFAYGLSYDKNDETPYTIERIEEVSNADFNQQKTKANIIRVLDAWKKRTGETKPKLVIVNVSGGGSRSALWTLNILQNLDKELNHNLTKHTQMITGASGGMVGAAYYRQLHLLYDQGKIANPFDQEYRDRIGSDLLNRLSFAASTNDIFFRYQTEIIDGKPYTKDRGFAFETQLHENTDGIMDVDLAYYQKYESSAQVPLMIFTPTIVNDGRRLLICSQPLTFLTQGVQGPSRFSKSYENIDYLSYFSNNEALDLRFSSVLRSSATFPFVMPMVTMPTSPEIQLMDAGLRDNYGGKITMEYLFELNSWIKNNTSGVIIVQIRDTKKVLDNEAYQQVSLLNKFTMPFGNMYSNFPRTQDFDQEELLKIGTKQFDFPVDLISFNLRENSKDRISLSWHLTTQEKRKIESAFNSRRNQYSLKQLKKLLK
ncbi:MAG: patatin-like phospholipase family protein [Crocinitomicaceae bacterium]|jgi:hypothetical protein|nr:patatin-like phospholipase family protein [Crocinitomicaceae bacterium]